MFFVQAAAGLHFYSGGLTWSLAFSSSLMQPFRTVPRVPPLVFISGRGEGKACLSGSTWLASEKLDT
jgi:hypothetical protein